MGVSSRKGRQIFRAILFPLLPYGGAVVLGSVGLPYIIGRISPSDRLMIAIIFAGYTMMAGLSLWRILSILLTHERIDISRDQLSIVSSSWGKTQAHSYRIHDICVGQHSSETDTSHKNLVLTYHAQPLDFSPIMRPSDRQLLAQHLGEILTFRCQSVEHIIFGTGIDASSDVVPTLSNPDVSTLTAPFVHLNTLSIEADTYELPCVERFITYAVNVMGRAYLKQCVEVRIYGHAGHVHPNLLKTLTELCQHISYHTKGIGE
jgi:hypothetical protein